MNRRRARSLAPASDGLGIGTAALFAIAVAGAAVLSACSASSDEAGETPAATTVSVDDSSDNASADASDSDVTGDSGATDASDTGDSDAGDGTEPTTEIGDETLSFGDPVDAGFEEVEDVFAEPEETPEEDQSDLANPNDVLPEVNEQLEDNQVIQGGDIQGGEAPGGELLDVVDEIDSKDEVAIDRDGRSRNSTGELAVLDDAASLACGHTEVALTFIDEGNGDIAIERIWSAIDQARVSSIPTIRDWEEPLSSVVADGAVGDVAPLLGFISACADGGYEL